MLVVHAVHYGVGRGQPSLGLVLSSAAIPALLVSLAPLRGRRWTMLAGVLLVSALGLGNAAYHRFFGEYIPLASFVAAGNGWRHRSYLPGLLHPADLAVLAVALMTLAVALLVRPRGAVPAQRGAVGLAVVACLVGLAPAAWWAWAVSPGDQDNGSGGFLYSELADLRRMAGEWLRPGEPTAEEWAEVLRATAAQHGAREVESAWFGAAEDANVLIVKIEGLNDWVLDLDVGGRSVMPTLRALEERGLRFTSVYDATGQGRSSDADYMLLASQHRLADGAVALVHPDLAPTTLARVLIARGYSTFSSDAGSPTSWSAAKRHRLFGFEQSRFGPDMGPERVGMGMPDRLFFGRVLPVVAALRPPFLSWMHNVSTHGPHRDLPMDMGTMSLGGLDGTPLGVFLQKVHYSDDVLGGFLAALDSAGALERTMIVVYGDHTESFEFDMQAVRRLTGISDFPDGTVSPRLTKIPLVVVRPGATVGRRIERVGGLIDVAPTLLQLLGVKAPRSMLGRSLLDPTPGFFADPSGRVITAERLWTGTRCYALADGTRRPASECEPMRAPAGEQIRVSRLITRYDLSGRIDGGGASALR